MHRGLAEDSGESGNELLSTRHNISTEFTAETKLEKQIFIRHDLYSHIFVTRLL